MNKKIIKGIAKAVPGCLLRAIPDKLYVRLLYFYSYGKFPNLKNPVTFDEKLQWYKLNYRMPGMTGLADKYEVRKYVEEKGLGYILNDIYFIKDDISEDDFANLPPEYVIKATHGCGMNIIKKKSDQIEAAEAVRTVRRWLVTNHYCHGREWAYKNVRPRVICEKYLENKYAGELIDYKFYCFGGRPVVVFVCAGRHKPEGVRYNAYDMDWNRIFATKGKPCLECEFPKPGNFGEMVDAAKKLCGEYPFVRVDLYSVENKVYFGEMTFYPDSGIIPFAPDEFNYYFGNLFILPGKADK
ncbi:MAG: hypothetical protein JXB33_07670 [Clostridia bacterium]|nr:hypothetical protein [Clostridia bacterium]